MALREASFKGAPFHVEETGGQFGRRTVLHEYPFRDLPYGEDLGRSAVNAHVKLHQEIRVWALKSAPP